MYLRKFHFFLVLILLIISTLGGCTKINEIEIPPPDFAQLVAQTGTFRGSKLHDTDPFRSIVEDYVVTVTAEGDKIYFEEKKEEYDNQNNLVINTYKFEVEFDIPKYKNAVGFTIPEQIVNGVKYKGLRYDEGDTAHGYYEVESAEGEPTNVIFFKLSTSGSTWTYFLNAQ